MPQGKKLYMIGNSHIDPVWFWDWEEGLQEVKSTFKSALDRMKEYPDMTFTATSSAFFEWIEQILPEMFEEIRQRVAEGRFQLTGGWFIEPDCILPCGEAFVRQGLYGQRYFREKFGKTCRTGSNVDSFGHTFTLPQILKKAGMEEYVFMRPRLDTPVFCWESPDGSRVNAVSLPSEYTTWFYESTREAVEMAADAAQKANLHGMPCCFGVGNHGGGPTKKNIESIHQLQKELPELELEFSGYRDFFDSLTEEEKAALPVRRDFFNKVNTGCYSMDGRFKRKNRQTEIWLLSAEAMLVMKKALTGKAHAGSGEMRELWKLLLFNQFHDTLGGTATKKARDEAMHQLDEVLSRCKKLTARSVQHIANHVDTHGEGFPLFLFNPSGEAFSGYVETEINWFCKDGLILLDEQGKEIPYQRTYTDAKVRNYNLGGRRKIIFHAEIPACGFAVYRTVIGEPSLACDIRREPEFPLAVNPGYRPDDTPYILENDHIRVQFNEEGELCSLFDKTIGYEALSAPVQYPVWLDERDTWGGMQERRYEDSGLWLKPEKLETVESGSLRKVVRAVYRLGGSRLEQRFVLYAGADHVEVQNRLLWDGEWKMLRMSLPLCSPENAAAECAYGTYFHQPEPGVEYSMHRFVDMTDNEGRGLCAVNDGKYTYVLEKGCLELPLARSAIFAQGSGKNWYNPIEGYEYADQGVQEFTFLLCPHGKSLSQTKRHQLAQQAEKRCLILSDCIHEGTGGTINHYSAVSADCGHVCLSAVKPGEEGGTVYRLVEIAGQSGTGLLRAQGEEFAFSIGPWEILSVLRDEKGWHIVNLLEDKESGKVRDYHGKISK